MPSIRQQFLQYQAQTSPTPLMLEIERAEGIYLYGAQGKRYIDLISGISVSNLGHGYPAVVKAVQEQAAKYMHLMVYGEVLQSPQALLAEKIVSTLPSALNNVYFVNSGSEAVEGAVKLAKRYTGRTGLISCVNAYHGSTQGALSLMGNEYFKRSFRPLLPGVKHIAFNSLEDLSNITEETAAIIVETVQGEAGIRVATPEWFKALRARCAKTGTLLILDEIQTGFGRTGTFWAFEQYQIKPDILVTAKGMGGGMPLGAFISSKEIMSVLTHDPVLGHITTYGGHPVSCAASLATITAITDLKLYETVGAKEQLFHALLKHPTIKEVRSKGLMIAVELGNYDFLKKVIDLAIEKGLLTDWFLFCDSAMRIAPPLIITEEEIRTACSIILQSINEAEVK